MENKGRRLDWKEACALLGCGKTQFYLLVGMGELPAYRIGRRRGLWVYEQDCRTFLKKRLISADDQK